MDTYSSTQLKNEMSTVYNSVQKDGLANIEHRDRPKMVLISKELLDSVLINKDERAVLIADLTF